MNTLRQIGIYLLVCALGYLSNSHPAFAQAAEGEQQQARDGQHDFDFLFGTWKFHLKRRVNPLSGSNNWVEFDGIDVARRVWDGRANVDELELDGPTGHIEGLTLRLYNPQSHQWSLYWANGKAGMIGGPPNVGAFNNGRGEFLCQDAYKGRLVLVRYIWSEITPNSAHFEQSYSDDGGKSWEANWITDQTRAPDESADANPVPTVAQMDPGTEGGASAERDGQHDFDFNFGTWRTHIKRLVAPLAGSTTWVELNGTVTIRRLLNGRAQLEEIEADGPNGHWEGLTWFLYNPQSHQWTQNFATSNDGTLNTPAIGEFKNGRGEFFDQEMYKGQAILVRIIWSDITPNAHRFEQSFSDDGGKTWEPNFVASLTRKER
jgi:predicted nucleic acid binding AN1-type Zn finger protein